MGCGCGKNASRPTRAVAKTPGVIRANVPPRTQQANVTPRKPPSISGLSVNRAAVNKQRQEAIKKSLGK
jgi:hypothetical protein